MIPFLRRRKRVCTALVPAAGESRRMEGAAKLFLRLNGAPVLARTLVALQLASRVDEIIVAVREEDLEAASRICKEYAITKCPQVIVGGDTRVKSVQLAAMAARRDADLLAVHDGARPLVTPELIDRVIEAAEKYGAAAPAVAAKDTVKRIKQDGTVDRTLNRSALRLVQTPQVFDADLLKGALQSAIEAEAPITDDCSAVERLGKEVLLIDGEEENLKLTTPLDLVLAQAVLEKRMAGE